MKKIAILTDSSSGITSKEAKENNIFLIPLHIIINNEKDILDTESETKKADFLNIVETSLMKTSQASTGELAAVFDNILNDYEEIIYYPIGENLSSQYQTAINFAENNEKYNNRVHIVECYAAAYALKTIVLQAKKLADNNLSAQEIINKTLGFEKEILMAMIPGNLKMLERGGRIKKMLFSIINLLKIKILLQWGENPKKIAASRTITNLINEIKKLLESFSSNFKGKKYQIIILKSPNCNKKMWQTCINELEKLNISYQVRNLPNVFIAHAGINTLGFVALPESLLK